MCKEFRHWQKLSFQSGKIICWKWRNGSHQRKGKGYRKRQLEITWWCWDITYIWTYEGFVYLTSIMDLFSRKIIAWVLSDTLEAKRIVDAAEKAKTAGNVEKPKIMHTDRGIQYVCREYIKAAEGMWRSSSKKALSMEQCMYRVIVGICHQINTKRGI